jgi:pimeloyl-ACP methyl ester carboxylesterase
MPAATASDGVKLHWEARGSGPSVLFTPYWSMHPSIFDPLEAILEPNFRVVRFDDRGTGESDRVGPYDMATAVSDLETICEEAGPFAVAICLVDSANRAVRIADERPDLIGSVVCMGSAPFSVDALEGSDSLISSKSVIAMFLQQLENDYRGALRSMISGSNSKLSEDEVRDRVQIQQEYFDGQAAVERARAWAADGDNASVHGQRLGERLHICLSHEVGGPGAWFPSASEMEPVVHEIFPEAGITWVSDGIVTAPEEAAGAIREVAASERNYDRQA